MLPNEKRLFRAAVQEKLSEIPPDVLQEKDKALFRRLLIYPCWKRCGLLFSFVSMKGEADTFPVIRQAITEGKLVALPRITPEGMNFHVLPPGAGAKNFRQFLEAHPYGFYQPKEQLPVILPSTHLVSLMLVPGIAFDAEGNRLGRGKGYYDSYLASHEAGLHTLGFCYSEQFFERIPSDITDKKIRAVISDSGILYQKK